MVQYFDFIKEWLRNISLKAWFATTTMFVFGVVVGFTCHGWLSWVHIIVAIAVLMVLGALVVIRWYWEWAGFAEDEYE